MGRKAKDIRVPAGTASGDRQEKGAEEKG